MNILVINPNITQAVTDLIAAEARRSAALGTQITTVTAAMGVAYIETRFEAMIAAYAVAQIVADHRAGQDAVVVAAFGDPGVAALREVLDIPVVGLTEAALATASLLGARVSIVAISHRIVPWYRETVEHCGMGGRLASIRALDRGIEDIGTVQEAHAERLLDMCLCAVRDDGADVIIVAGAPLAGLARTLGDRVPVPLVDGVSAAVGQAQMQAALGAQQRRGHTPGRATDKATLDLPASLVELLRGAHR